MFCGRVYIFLFQSFPLHDKSSVNLRAEFHVENTTSYDGPGEENDKDEQSGEKMDLDEPQPQPQEEGKKEDSAIDGEPSKVQQDPTVPAPSAEAKPEKSLNDYSTYAMFWSLQGYFSSPTKLFERENFTSFRNGLETTMAVFQQVKAKMDMKNSLSKAQPSANNDAGTPANDDSSPRGTKRKLSDQQPDFLYKTFNPKYLTSRHLFELEVTFPSNLSFCEMWLSLNC